MIARRRVLVVEDSLTVRRRLCEVLEASGEFEVLAEAADGQRAIELCLALKPDVITMDMVLPVISGLAATEYIMAHCPTPILIVSASSNRGEAFKTYEALAAGAIDTIEKPEAEQPAGEWERSFLSTLRIVARVRAIPHPRARLAHLVPSPPAAVPPHRVSTPQSTAKVDKSSWRPRDSGRVVELLVLGASTGGPGALLKVLSSLPNDFRVPILVVLHIGRSFATAFGDWLGSHLNRPVAYARTGEPVARLAGSIRLAPPDQHLIVENKHLTLVFGAERHSCRPSVDVLFESVARDYGPSAVGCLLTGMGRDGASGLLEMRQNGATTFAEAEETCVVYGMPREAVLLGGVDRVLPLPEIGPAVGALERSRRNLRP